MIKIITSISLTFVFTLFIWNVAYPDEADCLDQSFSLDAFGGEFRVPNYLQILVKIQSDNSVEIRMVRKIEEAGSIKLIGILRNGEYFRSTESSLKLVDDYEVNGFSVQIRESSDKTIGAGLKSAVIKRGGDTGHVVYDSAEALNSLLKNAEILDR